MVVPCPVCEFPETSERERPEWAKAGVGKWRVCNRCALLFQSPPPDVSDSYYETEYRSANYPTRWDRLVQLTRADRQITMLRLAGKRTVESALDWGCANGVLLEEIRKEFDCAIAGVELNAADRGMAENRGVAVYSHLEDIPDNDKFDLIVLSHTLEHVVDPVALLGQLRRRASHGAMLLIEVPSASTPSAWADFHTVLFGPGSLQLSCVRSGWRPALGVTSENESLLWIICRNDAAVEWVKYIDAHSQELGRYNWSTMKVVRLGDTNGTEPS